MRDRGYVVAVSQGINRVMPDQQAIFAEPSPSSKPQTNNTQSESFPPPPQIASFGRRFGAHSIDVGIIWIGGFVIAVGGAAQAGATQTDGWTVLLFVWFFLYRPVSAFLLGRTPGKAILGLCLVTDDNVPVESGSGRALVRGIMWTIFAVIPICNLAWVVTTLLRPKKQGWHDKIAGTVVVRKPR